MTTIILAVIVAILVIDRLFSPRKADGDDFNVLKGEVMWVKGKIKDIDNSLNQRSQATRERLDEIKARLNEDAHRQNETLRTMQEMANVMGYCIHIEEGSVLSFKDAMNAVQGAPLQKKSQKVLVFHKLKDEKKPRRKRK